MTRAAARIVHLPPARPAAATRERLLDAAERLFAARGFSATSVRDITAAAECNVAAVNYHFGSKENLYREMFRRRLTAMREQRIAGIRAAVQKTGKRSSLESILRAFTASFLEPHLDHSVGRRLMNLFSRELLDPHLPPGTFQRQMLGPVQDALTRALRSAAPGLGAADARRCIHSVIGQLVQVVQMGRLPGAARGSRNGDFSQPEAADHIVRFSCAGIRSYAR